MCDLPFADGFFGSFLSFDPLPTASVDGFDAIVPAMAAAGLEADLARQQIKFVIDDNKVCRRQLVKAHDFSDGFAGKIHEGLRFYQKDLLVTQLSLGDFSLEFSCPTGKGMAAGNCVRRHKADIVALFCVTGAGVAKACNKQHRRDLRFTKRQVISLRCRRLQLRLLRLRLHQRLHSLHS